MFHNYNERSLLPRKTFVIRGFKPFDVRSDMIKTVKGTAFPELAFGWRFMTIMTSDNPHKRICGSWPFPHKPDPSRYCC